MAPREVQKPPPAVDAGTCGIGEFCINYTCHLCHAINCNCLYIMPLPALHYFMYADATVPLGAKRLRSGSSLKCKPNVLLYYIMGIMCIGDVTETDEQSFYCSVIGCTTEACYCKESLG